MVKKKKEINIAAKEYAETVAELKTRILKARVKVVVAANKELIKLYWEVGQTISKRQLEGNWGDKLVEQLATDIRSSFPEIKGFSKRNVFRMRAFYRTYELVSQAVTLIEDMPVFSIPWGHNIVLVESVKDQKARLWYAQMTLQDGWSRITLEEHIKNCSYERAGKAITNFKRTLPKPQSHLAHEALKDPYLFDFLSLSDKYNEREVEQGLIDHIQKFLLALGKGFAFVGRQEHLVVDDTDFYIDLLFYHTKLRCYVVIELKNTAFKPAYAGQLNFYLSVVDDLLRHPEDKPTIGLLLCKTKKNFVVEYALKDINKPIGVAGYETELRKSLPKNLKGSLPTVEEIEAELDKEGALKEIEQKSKKKNQKKGK